MKKILKVFIIILVFTFVSIFLYSKILQAHADEGGKLFDERCNNVNPALIAYKNSYLQMWNIIYGKTKYPQDALLNKLTEYVNGIKKYLPLENDWIQKESAYINRWDFQLFEPDYVKRLANLQVEMYKSQKNSDQEVIRIAENPASGERFDSSLTDKFKKASEDYFKAHDEASKKSDWRKFLWKEPAINCPEENLHIPETDFQSILATPAPIPNFDVSG